MNEQEFIQDWLNDFFKSDLGNTLLELIAQSTEDVIIYGYTWDYPEEINLCLKEQGFGK
ncbi:MAG: hypothetical protein AAB875_07295 [Patescibacteria group bacterium]